MENLTDFEAGRLTGIHSVLASLEMVINDVSPQGGTPTAIAIRSILVEVLERTKAQVLD